MKWPKGWTAVPLLEVCQLNPRVAQDARPLEDSLVTFVPMAAIDENKGTISRPESRPYGEVAKGYTPFQEGDVLLAKVTPCMENGKAAIATDLMNGIGFGSTEFHVLRPGSHLVAEYLFYFIRQPWFRDQAAASFVGTGGLQRVPPDFFARVKIPLPSLTEQRRIVETLREVDTIVQAGRARSAALDEVRKTYFLELFGDPRSNPKGWATCSLDAFLEDVTAGSPRLTTRNLPSSGRWEVIDQGERDVAGFSDSDNDLYQGTLPVVLFGDHTRSFKFRERPFVIGADGLRVLKPKPSVRARFAYWHCRLIDLPSAGYSRHFKYLKQQTFICPPIELQQRFEEFDSQCSEFEVALRKAQLELDQLAETAPGQAFLGRLTATWRENHLHEFSFPPSERDSAMELERATERTDVAAPERRTGITRSRRGALIDALSHFQQEVWNTLRYEWRGVVLADDPTVFEDYCTNPQTAWRLEGFDAAPAEVRRALEQLAAAGLIRKFSLPREDLNIGLVRYLTAFRPLLEDEQGGRADEDAALVDAAEVRKRLASIEQGGV